MPASPNKIPQLFRLIYLWIRQLLTLLLMGLAIYGLAIVLWWVTRKIGVLFADGFAAQQGLANIGPMLAVLLLAIIPSSLIAVLMGVIKGGERQLFVRRYLQHKIAPLFALTAVMLCTAMVIIVSSIMGGFIEQMSESAHRLTGDVIIKSDLTGFPHYEKLIKTLKAQPEIKAATPVMRGYGLIKLHGNVNPVEVYGVETDSLSEVMDYQNSLYWTHKRITSEGQQLKDVIAQAKERGKSADTAEYFLQQFNRRELIFAPFDLEELGNSLKAPQVWPFQKKNNPENGQLRRAARIEHGVVIGIEVNHYNTRTGTGSYLFRESSSLGQKLDLTLLPISRAGVMIEPPYEPLVIVNESKSGLYEIDGNRIYVPFGMMQKMLQMHAKDEWERYEEVEGELIGAGKRILEPARASEVVIRGHETYSLDAIRSAVEKVRIEFAGDYPDAYRYTYSMTWREQFGTLLGAVNNEKGLLIFLFVIISLVSAVMVGVIFYMIVMEKTRDIGTLRAIGATRGGIITVFLAYGLTIGASGAALGMLLAELVVNHINDIHNWLRFGIGQGIILGLLTCILGLAGLITGGIYGARQPYYKGNLLERMTRNGIIFASIAAGLGIMGGLLVIKILPDLVETLSQNYSVTIWDPRVYFFDEIPTNLEEEEVNLIVTGAVCASVVGALIPAYLAGVVDPVRSLRYE